MKHQIAVDPSACVLRESETENGLANGVAPDLAYKRLAIVNVVFYGMPGASDRQWVLIDAGIIGSAGAIQRAATDRFGPDSRPAAIILTHGHFDHVGALKTVAEEWDAPIYAHELEIPYLNGRASYPPPDAHVGGGLMSTLSPLYPRGPVDVSRWLSPLPEEGMVPAMPSWQWIHTPGHSPGHVSLWREADRTLITGDAFITTNQESAYAVAVQSPELHGPPMYYTQDWTRARESVEDLEALEPELVVTGHGPAMHGPVMRHALRKLARHFESVAMPESGRYLKKPARVEDGTAYTKPR